MLLDDSSAWHWGQESRSKNNKESKILPPDLWGVCVCICVSVRSGLIPRGKKSEVTDSCMAYLTKSHQRTTHWLSKHPGSINWIRAPSQVMSIPNTVESSLL